MSGRRREGGDRRTTRTAPIVESVIAERVEGPLGRSRRTGDGQSLHVRSADPHIGMRSHEKHLPVTETVGIECVGEIGQLSHAFQACTVVRAVHIVVLQLSVADQFAIERRGILETVVPQEAAAGTVVDDGLLVDETHGLGQIILRTERLVQFDGIIDRVFEFTGVPHTAAVDDYFTLVRFHEFRIDRFVFPKSQQ